MGSKINLLDKATIINHQLKSILVPKLSILSYCSLPNPFEGKHKKSPSFDININRKIDHHVVIISINH